MSLGMEVGIDPGHIVLDGEWGPSSLPLKLEGTPPIFGPCLLWPNSWMEQMAFFIKLH